MLKDKVKIKLVSGFGGKGSGAVKLGRRTGGDGGDGGSIYLKGDINVVDLTYFTSDGTYRAEDGANGEGRHHKGEDGKDLTLVVPLTTEIYFGDELFGKVEEHDQVIKVLEGGRGSYGNVFLKIQPDEELSDAHRVNAKADVTLVMKLKSDVIFIGYPNAGKSSMLNELTNAKAKIAAYAFTTLNPQLGLMDGYRLMDLPGLIEGTYEGKGLGTRFVKHTEYSNLVAHFVSMENENPVAMYKSMRAELKRISEDLYSKREFIVLSKTDESDPNKIKLVTKEFNELGLDVVACSIIDENSIAQLKAKIIELLKK
jgi:GTP-binding protein